MSRVKREILEALWSESRDLREDAARMRARVLANQRQSEALRARIAFGRAHVERPGEGVLAKS